MGEAKEHIETIELPEKTEARVEGRLLIVKGAKGEVQRDVSNPLIKIEAQGNKITVKTDQMTKKKKKMMFTLVAHIKNMIKGSNKGHKYTLKICSSHFPMNVTVNKDQVIIKNFIGEKFPRTLNLKKGVTATLEGELINVESNDKELAGTTASDIERLTRRPNFDNRIFQDGIFIINKDGKQLK